MKRLLTYLFIVLGLGLVVNVNAEANKYELQYCLYEGNSWSDVKRWKSTFKVGHEKCKIIDKRENRGLFLGITKHMRPGALNKTPREYTIDTYKLKILIAENKKEPSQTQQVAKKNETKWITKKKTKKKIEIKDEVSEAQQKEINVKTKKLDTTGPEIEIAEAITVDDSSYSLKGKVSDKGSDKIYIKVDGQDISVEKGKV